MNQDIILFCRMGTHSSGPAKVGNTDILLSNWLSENPEAVGKVPDGYPSNDLPFLFKVLSVNTALSIQVSFITLLSLS
jgi:mannose-6-phosphate isomerase